MNNQLLILITGHPCTGKTTLGKRLAEELNLPFVSKDDFKELLFDTLGWKDREWSKKLGTASYTILYHVAESILKTGWSLVMETNFHPVMAAERIRELEIIHGFKPFQILCHTEGKTLVSRFKMRAESGNRHEGHRDAQSLDEWEAVLSSGKIEALDIGGELYELDTTDLEAIDIGLIVSRIRNSQTTNN